MTTSKYEIKRTAEALQAKKAAINSQILNMINDNNLRAHGRDLTEDERELVSDSIDEGFDAGWAAKGVSGD